MNRIHKQIEKHENELIKNKKLKIENSSNDSQHMFKAVNSLKNHCPKQTLLIQSKNGLTANENEQVKIIADYFQSQFFKNAEPMPDIQFTEMNTPFTMEEIKMAVKLLKNNKSEGIDCVKAELLKYGPDIFCTEIATIFNNIPKSKEYPKELIQGIITALQKPGKPKGPLNNLRPITLLSMLRKLLANCIIKRIGHKIDADIPFSQAAYRKGRSTTEHVFATKILAEKAATSTDFPIYILLLDMSKAFDTIIRKKSNK